MKNENSILLSLIASLLLAIGTDWSKASKALVVISSIALIISAIKKLKKEIKNEH